MNIFYLDKDPKKAAKYHCDKHVVKMILESAQLLSSAHYKNKIRVFPKGSYNKNNPQGIYKLTHENHPCSKWVKKSSGNYLWLCELADNLLKQYTLRYKKKHACHSMIEWFKEFIPNHIPIGKMTRPCCVVAEDCFFPGNTVKSYRIYYVKYKSSIARWDKGVEEPQWYKDYIEILKSYDDE